MSMASEVLAQKRSRIEVGSNFEKSDIGMSEWIATRKLADVLNTDTRLVRLRAQREGWTFRDRIGQGGGKEFAVETLPEDVRLRLGGQDAHPTGEGRETAPVVSQVAEIVAAGDGDEVMICLDLIRAHQREEAECKARGGKWDSCWVEFQTAYNEGRIAGLLPETLRKYPPGKCPSRGTVKGWDKMQRAEGVEALRSQYGKRKGRSKITEDGELLDAVLGCMALRLTVPKMWHKLVGQFGRERVPSETTIARFISQWKAENPQAWTYFDSPEEWRNKYQGAAGKAAAGVERPNQEWQMDATIADVSCVDGRYYVLGLIDVFSRRVKFLVEKSSSSFGQVKLLRAAILELGKPETVHTDNGKDYASKYLSRCLAGLRIEQQFCTVKSPWEKPFIERVFGTLTRDLFAQLPGFVGHNVADRKKIRARQTFEVQLTASELQQRIDAWVTEYEQRHHEGIEMPPIAKWASVRWTPVTVREEDLAVLLAPTPANNGVVTVSKKGIRVEGVYYFDAAGDWNHWIGQQVQCRWAGADAGEILVMDLQEKPLFWAYNAERAGLKPEEHVRNRKRQRQEVAKTAKQLQKLAETQREALGQGLPVATIEPLKMASELYDAGFERLPVKVAGAIEALEAVQISPTPLGKGGERNEVRRKEVDLEIESRREQAQAAEMAYVDGTPTEAEWEVDYRRKPFGRLSEVDRARYRRYVAVNPCVVEKLDEPRMWDLPEDLKDLLSEKSQRRLLEWARANREHWVDEIVMRFPKLREPDQPIDLTGAW